VDTKLREGPDNPCQSRESIEFTPSEPAGGYDEQTGEVTGCAYFDTIFTVSEPHRPTTVTVATVIHRAEPHLMMAWISPADDPSTVAGRLATPLFKVSTAP